MSPSAQKPSAIIFGWCFTSLRSSDVKIPVSPGGLNTCSRPLAAFLVPPEGEALVSVCMIVVARRFIHPNSPSMHDSTYELWINSLSLPRRRAYKLRLRYPSPSLMFVCT